MPAVILLVSCGNQTPETSTAPVSEATPVVQQTGSSSVATSTETIKFKQEGGAEVFALKPKSDGVKLVNGNDQEVARFNLDQDKLKIKNSADKTLGYVITKNGSWKVENPEQTKELYILRRQNDGDYKLEDGSNKEIYRIKKRDYGFEIETPTKQSLYKVKVKDSKISLRDTSDKTVLYTKSGLVPVAVTCFGFDVLSQEQKAALAYAVNLSGGQ